MSFETLLIAPMAVGHVALFVLAANALHAFGQTERALVPLKVSFVVAFSAVSAALLWGAWHGPYSSWGWTLSLYGGASLVMGLVAFPASTAYLRFRSRPVGITERVSEVNLSGGVGNSGFLGQGRYAWMLKLPGNESTRLRKIEWELTLPGLPPSLDGLSILHLSDFHFAPNLSRRYFEAVADEAAGWESDLVLFTGDLIDHEDCLGWVVPTLSRIRGKVRAFSILGNHDLMHDPGRIRQLLNEAGFTDLEASWATVAALGKTLALGGTSYPWGPQLPLDGAPEADWRILLSHCPDRFYWAERAGFDLMLSGHNHGGQIRLPVVGAVFMPSVYSRRFDRGFFRKNALTMHVSQGISGKHPVRYGCVPEIGRLVLRSACGERRDTGHDATSRSHGHGQRVVG